jgi:hypothetical protein
MPILWHALLTFRRDAADEKQLYALARPAKRAQTVNRQVLARKSRIASTQEIPDWSQPLPPRSRFGL